MFTTFIYIGVLLLVGLIYIIIRVFLIQNEIRKTWNVKNWGFFEELLKNYIAQDIEKYKNDIDQGKKNKRS